MEEKTDNDFINPIDKDHITEIPNYLAYPHHRGSTLIKPEDQGKIKSRAYKAMEQQTDNQLTQIYQQIEVLAKQAKAIKKRIHISTLVYQAEIKFEPLINHSYHLYLNKKDIYSLAVIGPKEWKKSFPYKSWIATVTLLADHTWEVIDSNDEIDFLEVT
jgi:hypothetical protein